MGASALLRRRRRDRLARRARQTDDHLARNPKIEADHAAAEQAGRFVEPGELVERRARVAIAFGQRERLARLEIEVPAAAADPGRRRQLRLERRDRSPSAARGLRPFRSRRGRSAAAGRASCRPATRSRTTPSLSISASRPWFCHSAVGVRSTISMTSVSGRRRETRASLTQPNCSSRRRIAATSTSAWGALAVPASSPARLSSSVTTPSISARSMWLMPTI